METLLGQHKPLSEVIDARRRVIKTAALQQLS
jgi:hypothetical protein